MYISINTRKLTEKEQNILIVLDEIIENDILSTIDLAKRTSLSASTISRVLALLLERKLVLEMGKEETVKGRFPKLIGLNKRFGLLIHFSITHNEVSGYLADLDGKILYKACLSISADNSLEQILGSIKSLYRKFQKFAQKEHTKILAASISLPGTVNNEQKLIQRIPDVFPFNDVNLFEHIEKMLELPFLINNTSVMAVAGEYIQNYSNKKHLVYINILKHIGIGAGLIINRELVHGADNYAGEIGNSLYDCGHFNAKLDSPVGCLEEYAGIKPFFSRLEDAMSTGSCEILKNLIVNSKDSKLTLNLIEQAIIDGDQAVSGIFDEVLKMWAMLVINMNLTLNPDLFVLGGVVTSQNQYTLERLRYFINTGSFFRPHIEIGMLGEMAPVVGGLHTLRKYVFNEILSFKAIE